MCVCVCCCLDWFYSILWFLSSFFHLIFSNPFSSTNFYSIFKREKKSVHLECSILFSNTVRMYLLSVYLYGQFSILFYELGLFYVFLVIFIFLFSRVIHSYLPHWIDFYFMPIFIFAFALFIFCFWFCHLCFIPFLTPSIVICRYIYIGTISTWILHSNL